MTDFPHPCKQGTNDYILEEYLHFHFQKCWLPMRQRPKDVTLDLNLLYEAEAWYMIFPCNWESSMSQFLLL